MSPRYRSEAATPASTRAGSPARGAPNRRSARLEQNPCRVPERARLFSGARHHRTPAVGHGLRGAATLSARTWLRAGGAHNVAGAVAEDPRRNCRLSSANQRNGASGNDDPGALRTPVRWLQPPSTPPVERVVRVSAARERYGRRPPTKGNVRMATAGRRRNPAYARLGGCLLRFRTP